MMVRGGSTAELLIEANVHEFAASKFESICLLLDSAALLIR